MAQASGKTGQHNCAELPCHLFFPFRASTNEAQFMRRIFWLVLVGGLACTTLGSSDETLTIPVILERGLRGYVDIQARTVGGPLIQEDSRRHWANDIFDIRLIEACQNGQSYIKIHVESPSGALLGIEALSFRVVAPTPGMDGVWTPSWRISDDRFISADPGKDFVTYSAANYDLSSGRLLDRLSRRHAGDVYCPSPPRLRHVRRRVYRSFSKHPRRNSGK
jgi:hypothetical protein